jgi:GNAT superfamily N-acetyltransferase
MLATGMSKYIPEYFLVYVAVRADQRGKGIGAKIIKESIDSANGDVALHVEYDNPAKRLYERVGFTSKYAEMRFNKDK